MNWFLIALGAPFLWALTNVSDQFLVARYSQTERGSGALVLFSSLIGIFVAAILALFVPGVFTVALNDILLLLITGILTISWVILYLFTLETEDVSSVVPWFLTVPIFGYILGYIFLGETLTSNQLIGSLVVLCGLSILLINFSDKKTFKLKPALYMIFACLMIAISGVIFKYVTISGSFWLSSFWEYVGLGLAGVFIYIFIPHYRHDFMEMNRNGGRNIFALNLSSEIMTIGGNLLTNFALLLAPVTMVYLVGSFQPLIVIILTLLGTRFFPHIVKEDTQKKVFLPKVIAILVMIIGSIILFT